MRTRTRTTTLALSAGAAVGALLAPALATASAPPDGTGASGDVGTITVGSADFPESELLAQIYGQSLEGIGIDVDYQLAIGSREAYFGAIENNEVQLVPEYTNALLSFVLLPDRPTATNLDEQVAELGEVLPEGLQILTPSTAEDKDVIACTPDAAEEYGLATISDLAAASGDITLGAPPEFETRSPWGLVGFSELLDAEFAEFVPLGYGDIPAALDGGAIDCGNVFSTSSVVATSDWVVLDDDAGLVPGENVVPLIRTDVATPEVVAALDDVSAALDTETLKTLVAQVEVDALGPDVVAADWLASLDGSASVGTEATDDMADDMTGSVPADSAA